MSRGAEAETAKAAIPQCRARIAELGSRQAALREQLAARQSAIGAAQSASRREAMKATPARLAELHRDIGARAGEFDRLMARVADLMHEDDADRLEAARLLNVSPQTGFFAIAGFRNRAQGAAARGLAIDAGRSLEAGNSLLGIASPYRSARALLSLEDHTGAALDGAVPFFVTLDEAEAAADRLAAAGDDRIILPIGAVFMLVERHRAFADREEAEAAGASEKRRRVELAVVAGAGGGFVLIQAHLIVDEDR
jgi:hypothetical protein